MFNEKEIAQYKRQMGSILMQITRSNKLADETCKLPSNHVDVILYDLMEIFGTS